MSNLMPLPLRNYTRFGLNTRGWFLSKANPKISDDLIRGFIIIEGALDIDVGDHFIVTMLDPNSEPFHANSLYSAEVYTIINHDMVAEIHYVDPKQRRLRTVYSNPQ